MRSSEATHVPARFAHPNYENPEAVVCVFSYDELDEISESLLYAMRHDPDVDRDYNEGLRKHVKKIMKRVRQNNPELRLDNQNNLE